METAVQRNKTRDMVYVATFAALMAICSWISIPTDPPFTLQTMGVFLSVGLLGGKRSSMAVGLHMLLGAIGLLGAGLADTVVLTAWTAWGPLPRPNAYFAYDSDAERTKDWAIHCHASQVLLTDYPEYCSHLGRAYAALAREWAGGHSLAAGRPRGEERFVGVELFQLETAEATAGGGTG